MYSAPTDHNITQGFLRKALGDEYNILSHKVANGTKPGDNFMSVTYSIVVQLEDKKGGSLTKHLFIKCYPSHPGRQEFLNRSNMFYRELEIYKTWIPELKRFQTETISLSKGLKLPYPSFVHGNCIDFQSEEAKQHVGKTLHPLDNYIILEDLRKTSGFKMTNRRESLDINHMRLVICELAKIHALSWAYKNHVEKDITKTFSFLDPKFGPQRKVTWMDLMSTNIVQAVTIIDNTFGVGNELSKASIRFKDTSADAVFDAFFTSNGDESTIQKLLRKQPDEGEMIEKDSPNAEPWRIICHGDCWSNNMLFRYDDITNQPLEVVLVDLQIVRETCVVNDLVYIIYVCTRTDLRQKYLDELLELYHDKFNEFCEVLKTETLPGFNKNSFRFRFHRAKLLGFFLAVCCLPSMLKEEEKATNLEELDHNKDVTNIFTEESQNLGGLNTVLNERITELTQELYDQGVI